MKGAGGFPAGSTVLPHRCGTTERADGSFEVPDPGSGLDALAAHADRWAAVTGHPTTWLRQHHGSAVVVVTAPGEHSGAAADAAVTAVPGAALAVITADCAPVVLVGRRAIGIAHAGWRGLLDGVVERTVDQLVGLGEQPSRISAWIGPCISAARYRFDEPDLARVEDRYGPSVRARDLDGEQALDLIAGVRAALAVVGVAPGRADDTCTASSPTRWWSWRARRDRGRHGTWVVIEPASV